MFNSQTIFTLLILVSIAINVTAVYGSRKGRARLHSLAFVSGITGLCALPITVIAALSLAVQVLTPSHGSPASILFYTVGLIFILATLCSAITSVLLRAERKDIQAFQ